MGRWISYWEHRLNKGAHRKIKGAIMALISIVLIFDITWVVLYLLLPYKIISLILQSILVFYCLAGHTLRKEVKHVFLALDCSLEQGRQQVGRIVGRDTTSLTAQECRTAALETLAENLSDGVIAPLFWYLLLGVPGMLMYKMINTMDSMIGYHSERYLHFGCWAAHIDDCVNWIPARLTALLMVVASSLLRAYRRGLPSFIWHFCRQHSSPNSGWPEATLAGILNCRFGGPHTYFGQIFPKPYIGINDRPITAQDMRLSITICFIAEVMAVLISFILIVFTH